VHSIARELYNENISNDSLYIKESVVNPFIFKNKEEKKEYTKTNKLYKKYFYESDIDYTFTYKLD